MIDSDNYKQTLHYYGEVWMIITTTEEHSITKQRYVRQWKVQLRVALYRTDYFDNEKYSWALQSKQQVWRAMQIRGGHCFAKNRYTSMYDNEKYRWALNC